MTLCPPVGPPVRALADDNGLTPTRMSCWYKAYRRMSVRLGRLRENKVAEEVGVEPTGRLSSAPTALKAARPTGDDALP